MKRHLIPVFLVTTLVCGCSQQSKPPDQPASPPPAARPVAQQPASEPASDSEGSSQGLGDYVGFPACGIKIRQPEGFEKADTFDGFANPETQSSVMALSLGGPYAEISAGFTQGHMRARGWTLRSREDVTVDGLPGILVHFEQPAAGKVFLKWCLVFGDARKTAMVTAAFPKSQERELSTLLKAAVLSARPDQAARPDAETNLPFTLAASPKLKFTPAVSRTLTYTKDGVVPTESPKDPLFIAAPGLGKVGAGERRQFAERRLRETALTKGLVVKSTAPITIAGLDGYESLATAQDAKSGTPLTVYQVILFDEGSYILMQGLVGTELRDEYLPEFKAMARSLQRKKP